MNANRNYLDKRDFISIFCLLVLVLLFHCARTTFANKNETYAEIAVDGHVEALLSLDENVFFTPSERPEVQIVVHDGQVGFSHSNCPDKTCVRTGFLSIPGDLAICLPNKIVLRVRGGKGDELDAITY